MKQYKEVEMVWRLLKSALIEVSTEVCGFLRTGSGKRNIMVE